MPLGVRHPEHVTVRIEASLPAPWPQEMREKTISDPAFSLETSVRSVGTLLNLEYEYQSSADWVPVNRVQDYLERVDEASRLLGHALNWP